MGKRAPESKLGRNTGNAGLGRPKGVPNKTTAALKDMILGALDRQGGVDYLVRQAEANPAAFMSLLGKVLPTTLTADPETITVLAVAIEAGNRRIAGE